MAESIFTYEGQIIKIQCYKNQKMKEICKSLCIKINEDINSLIFLGEGIQLNLEKTFSEITKENKISILVYKKDIEICPKCGRIINDKMIDDIILSNNNINYTLIEIKRQIEHVMNDVINQADINFINHQLNNINLIINNISENIKKINNELNQIKFNGYKTTIKQNYNNQMDIKKNNMLKQDYINNKKDEQSKNEILCIYNKQNNLINLLHDYNRDMNGWPEEWKKQYIEGKNNINEKNIDIYINGKKISFNYKYQSNEQGYIKVKFIFKKLLTNTCWMFGRCSSLKSIDLSGFNARNIKDMSGMFYECSSLESINLSSFNTTNVNNMGNMFYYCSSLKSIDLSSYNTTKVNNISCLFAGCCSLKSIDLSSFNTTNVNNMSGMFYECSSLKKENIKFNNSDKKLLNEINNYIRY